MKCYYHHDRDAFGICRSCGKALCLECMAHDLQHVVCANSKECLNREIQNEKFYKNANVVYSAKSIAKTKLCGSMMLLFGLFSVMVSLLGSRFDFGLLILGLFFTFIGGSLVKRSKEFVPTEDGSGEKNVKESFQKYVWLVLALCIIVFFISLFLTPSPSPLP